MEENEGEIGDRKKYEKNWIFRRQNISTKTTTTATTTMTNVSKFPKNENEILR